MTTIIRIARSFAARLAALVVLALAGTASSAVAETLLMPKRDARVGSPVVIWGITTRANATAFSINFGDGTGANGNVSDRSYINFTKTYATPGVKTVTLTIAGEIATTEIQVFAPAGETAAETERNVRINSAIQDGLRYLWFSQSNRTTFDSVATTNWGRPAFTALVVLAFENHNYRLPNDNTMPTGIYEKYIVRRGLNYLFSSFVGHTLTAGPTGSPCAGPEPATEFAAANSCLGFYANLNGDTLGFAGYTNALMILPLAGSGALNRQNLDIPGVTGGKTFREIVQRLLNAMAFGQNDPSTAGRGGWNYGFNQGILDGSTAGWNVLAILDAQAAGIPMPPFLIPEFAIGINRAFNDDGSFDYNADNNPNPPLGTTHNHPTHRNLARGGIGAQAHFLLTANKLTPNISTAAIRDFINSRWPGTTSPNQGSAPFDYWATCNQGGGVVLNANQQNANANRQNKGCAYSMFNVFKGLKLLGIQTLANVVRGAGPGAIPANDWYADYQDFLLNTQFNPSTNSGGNWNMVFSCCADSVPAATAIGELILSSVALVLPDAERFAAVGLGPSTASGVESSPGALSQHTVTAIAEGPVPGPGVPRPPVPGATVNFVIVSGPNAGLNFSGVTGADGKVSWTYTDSLVNFPLSSFGTDRIRASIGTLQSNEAVMNWIALDQDGDGVPDTDDNCQFTANTDQANTDGDSEGDACDADDDDDGDLDGADNCPLVANPDQANTDGDSEGDACDADDDNDGDLDGADNCPLVMNADQANTDGDSEGDACDADDDNDGDLDGADNCPLVMNADQANTDGDAQGDACDADDDNDTIDDATDNCQFAANTDQANNDGDALGDACDLDDDNDGAADGADNCQFVVNPGQANNDGDAAGDICDPDDDNDAVFDGADNCQFVPNPEQANTDGDPQGDACDADDDNDTVVDGGDNCPLIANSDQTDTDRDGTGNACDATPGLLAGRMNGGGGVFTTEGGRVTHGFALYCNPEDDPQRLQVNWGGNRFQLDSVSHSWCGEGDDADPPVTNFDHHNGSGTGRYNGQPGATVTWTFTDAGGPGAKDTARITITLNGVVVLHVSGDVNNGNHQAHR